MSELKACPFCGGEAALDSEEMLPYEILHIKSSITKRWYYIYCTKCLAESSSCLTEEEAIDSWNRRIDNG